MLHESLWQSNIAVAQACLAHPFIEALAAGTLNGDCFRAFIAQDVFFLRTFLKAYALALARCDDGESTGVFCDLIGGVQTELKVHAAYADELGISFTDVVPNPACRAYTDFLLRTAWHASLEETIAAMTPCMRLYAYLGAKLQPRSRPQHPYLRWISAYSSTDFEELAARLEGLLDRLCTDSTLVRSAYRYAMECELNFFSNSLST